MADAYANMASLLYLEKNYQAASEFADRAIELKPYFTEAILIKMRILSTLNDMAEFQKLISSTKISEPDRFRINLEAGLIYSNKQMYDSAQKYLGLVLRSQIIPAETDDRAFTYSGLTGRQMSYQSKAKAAYQLGYIFGLQNRLKESIKMSNLAISYDSSQPEPYINLINGYRLMGHPDSANSVMQKALIRFPKNDILNSMAR